MENTLNENLIDSTVSLGIPTCECGQCINELMDGDSEEIVITQEALNVWLQKVCPGPAPVKKVG